MILMPTLVFMSGLLMTLSIRHLGQSVFSYYDFVALIMVVGGTSIVGAALLPWEYRGDLKRAFSFLIRPEKRQYSRLLADTIKSLQSGRYQGPSSPEWLYHKILKDGAELIQIGFTREKIESILSERAYHSIRRWKKISSAFRNLAKYPPAFGLMGTVFGLVNIMKNLAGAADAGKLGVEMSVALVATMYGLLIANFVVNPIGELLMKKAEEEEEYASVAMEAVLLMKDQAPMMESVELLNSMIPEEVRQNLEGVMNLDEAA